MPASYPTEETAPHIGSRSRSVRLSLLPSESSKARFTVRVVDLFLFLLISFFFFFFPPLFASFSIRVHAFRSATIHRTGGHVALSLSRHRQNPSVNSVRSVGPSSSERRTSIVGLRPAVRPVSSVFIFVRQRKCSRRLIEVIGLNRNNPVDASRLVNSLHLSPPLLCSASVFISSFCFSL